MGGLLRWAALPSLETATMNKPKTYSGHLDAEGAAVVTVNGKRLPLRLKLRNHSPTGFAWGYSGSGPAQLALALLVDFLGDAEEALRLYQSFKARVVTRLPFNEPWTLSAQEVAEHVEALRQSLPSPEPTP